MTLLSSLLEAEHESCKYDGIGIVVYSAEDPDRMDFDVIAWPTNCNDYGNTISDADRYMQTQLDDNTEKFVAFYNKIRKLHKGNPVKAGTETAYGPFKDIKSLI